MGGVTRVYDGALETVGYQEITDLSSAVSLTVPAGATLALITARDQAISWRSDSSASGVSASNGHTIAAGEKELLNVNLAAIRLIEEAASAKAIVTYFRGP